MTTTRYFITGLFVLGGAALLAVLIVWFGDVAGVLRGGYEVRAHLSNSMGITPGKRVHRDGLEIGDVSEVTSSLPARPGVWLHLRIDPEQRIPRDAALVAVMSATGRPFIDFRTAGADPEVLLPADGSAEAYGRIVPYSFLPDDVTDQLGDLDVLVSHLQELTQPRTAADVEAGGAVNLPSTLDRISRTAHSLQKITDDPNTRQLIANATKGAEELRETLARARDTFEQMDKTLRAYQGIGKDVTAALDSVRGTSEKAAAMVERMAAQADRAGELVAKLDALATDLREGKGTAGKLLSDAELHDALLVLVENLSTMTTEVKRLVTLWRQEGIMAKED